ncbi:MAG TPA: sigma-70 family RNA polymerase sigma factor [Urbifossiella sp.]|jgi:RNA polymerase sigma-70 factor (ECF subfamily)|nr:sigma-70 family RNA polymerase sigma factor [Urbifossiella sp.]
MGPDELAGLVDRHAAALVLYARQWCGCPEDVVQTAFLKLVRLRARPENVVPWLYRVVRNGAIDASRSARRRQKYEAAAADRTDSWFSPSDDPAGLDARAAADALTGLPDETREIVVAHLWGGLTFEQIAQMLGSSAATCYRRYAAGLAALRQKLGAECPATPTK